VVILVVAGALILSRADMANELTVVRSQLSAANRELAEDQVEIDELEDTSRNQSESLDTCRQAAELGEQVRKALVVLQEGLDRGKELMVARGVADAVRLENEWTQANKDCLEATGED
jgi:hypothetical protein